MRGIRTVAVVSLIVGSIAVMADPAMAASPANDTYSGREVLTEPLPIVVIADTSEATTDADDPELNALCGAPEVEASVWYEYTPTVEGERMIDMLASDYSVGAIVATGTPGDWSVETCGPETIQFYAMPGTTYTILLYDDQQDGGGNGGDLEFSIALPPPPPTIEVTVQPRGTFDPHTGQAQITGTYVCAPGDTGAVEDAYLNAYLTQRVGLDLIGGVGFLEELRCDGTEQPWTIDVEYYNGAFRGGKAVASVLAEACSTGSSCGHVEDVQLVKLSAVRQ